ncbi:MAG: NitT/TauT family transport system substrate-binding protein [Paraglaciecola sp.]|jgi:NitT/TauT family transport system substrate-binding protein
MFNIRLGLLLFLPCFAAMANAPPEVRLGVLKYGTVNWEVDVIKHHKLDEKYKFDLKTIQLGSKNASAVALQSEAVDIILTDWLWVNRQRSNQKLYTMFPTSIATGGLYVSETSTVDNIADLRGQKIGIAGGEVDKNWLLLQAYSRKKYGFDIKQETVPTFTSPPLLNVLMLRGELAAAINFWHYGARLKAQQFRLLVTVPQMLAELDIDADVPLLGWVFEQQWAQQNPDKISRFLQASLEAKQILYSSDAEWDRIRNLTKAENDSVFLALKDAYRAGLIHQFGARELKASEQIFSVLAEQGGQALVGQATSLDAGTFWAFDKRELTPLPTSENDSDL